MFGIEKERSSEEGRKGGKRLFRTGSVELRVVVFLPSPWLARERLIGKTGEIVVHHAVYR